MRTFCLLIAAGLLVVSYFCFATILLIYDQYLGIILLTIGYIWLMTALASEEDKRRAARGRSHCILDRNKGR